ncbi:Na+/H+ antiporter NhaA [Desulfofalx alkaliphila]|uniref:Na+/H+ antiporter NhaA n=1 Tax=Desulfofalx alkaliphila TaxID=105483 RepID=UPI0004E227B6|nr:Na+/H+ antiporter NhaA [Desulfofalx alkaliphila]
MSYAGNSLIAKMRLYSVPLILGVIVAVIWANINYDSYYNFINFNVVGTMDVNFLVNDIFMVFFFAIAAVEITVALSKGGSLNPIRKAVNPLFSCFGGILGPVLVFFILNALIGAPEYARGWAIPTATDIALAWLLARVIFGVGHPAIAFLLLLAVVDDGIGLGIIAVFYPNPDMPTQPIWLLGVLAGIAISFAMRKMNVKSFWPYVIVGGLLSWFGLYNAGLNPALALVAIIPFLPNDRPVVEGQGLAPMRTTLGDFEHKFSPYIDFGLFFFGLANAGVQFASMSNITLIILLSLIIGKTVGIYTAGRIAEMAGFPLPDGMSRKHLAAAGLVAALGLTVALFVAGVAFVDPEIQGAAKMGALFSVVVFIIAPVWAKLLGVKKGELAAEDKAPQAG